MKESVTQFDLEAAFKALDEIDIPVSEKGIKENRPALTEIFSRKSKFESLFEEYYDIGSTEELGEAKEEREGEIAKAKLKRIEKIVDLDAESPEDLLTSYVGKYIIQCPQCMTLFYKDKEDVVESEEDSSTVNVGEQCQHCGNESGYSLIGKVGEAEPEEAEVGADELPIADEELPTEEAPEENPEEESTEGEEDLGDFDLEALNLEDETVEEEDKKEESFTTHEGDVLVEEVQDDKDLDAKLAAHNEYIEYLRTIIAQEEDALEKVDNEQVKAAIQRRIDAFKEDLEMALPDAVKNDATIEIEAPVEDPVEEEGEIQEEALDNTSGETLTEALKEEADLEVSAEEFEKLINEPEFKKPISDIAVRAMLNSEKDSEEKVEENIKVADETESLEEGKLGDFFKNIGDSLARTFKTTSQKADWVLKHTMTDYSKATVDEKGNFTIDENDRRFKVFMVICYEDAFSSGNEIKAAPAPDCKNMVVASGGVKVGDSYQAAEDTAKGWSLREGNGPAYIYLAANDDGDDGVFIGEYFKGKLYHNKVDAYFKKAQNGLKGARLEKRGQMRQKGVASEATKETAASKIEVGDQIKTAKGLAEVTEVKASSVLPDHIDISIKFTDGATKSLSVEATAVFNVAVAEVAESLAPETTLNIIMESIDELQEESLEQLISNSLVETYKNVAGYRLTNCEYLNENLSIVGNVYFTSGKTRQLTYTFSEVCQENGKVKLSGLNEKLGKDKQFMLTGRIDTNNKMFITESFSNK